MRDVKRFFLHRYEIIIFDAYNHHKALLTDSLLLII